MANPLQIDNSSIYALHWRVESLERHQEGVQRDISDMKELSIEMRAFRESVQEQFKMVNQRFEQVNQRFEQIDKRFELVDKRFEQVDKRFDQVDRRLGQLDRTNYFMIGLLLSIVGLNISLVLKLFVM